MSAFSRVEPNWHQTKRDKLKKGKIALSSDRQFNLLDERFKLIKTILLWLIEGYRRVISPLFPPSCRFQPTCSQYALEAIAAYGAVKGSWLAIGRILRCHPFHPGGYDPVPAADSCDDLK